MKKKYAFILTFVLLVLVLALCACDKTTPKDFATYSDNMKTSMDSVSSVNASITMQDKGTTVYRYQRNMTINGSNADISVSESKLNASFKLVTTTSTEQKSGVDRTQLLPIALSEYSANNLNLGSDGFTCTISAEDFASVLKLGAYSISGEASLACDFSGDKLSKINCNFTTTDGKTVQVVYEFNY